MMKKNIIITFIVCILVTIAVYQNIANADKDVQVTMEEAPKTNFLAPSFELPGMEGNNYQVGGPRDKLLLINFWASWCEPCKMEARDLQDIHMKYKDVLDLYGVNATSYDSEKGATKFVAKYQLTFPIMFDKTGDVTEKYQIEGYPTSYLVNRDGVIVETFFGLVNADELDREIKKQMK